MNLQNKVDLLPYNTFHFSCIADYFCILKYEQDRQELIKTEIFHSNKRLILGGGSNILLTQDSFHGLVIKNEIMGKGIITQDESTVTIQVGAGENRNDFVLRSIDQGYCGLENLVSIPGTVGAAPIQNIGAYGVEARDSIIYVEYYDIQGNVHILDNSDCHFGYRESIFKHELKDKICITRVVFQLQKYCPSSYLPSIHYGAISAHLTHLGKDLTILNPYDVAETISFIRTSKMPDWKKVGTAGSFFKNPLILESQYLTLKEQSPDLIGHSSNLLVGTEGKRLGDRRQSGVREETYIKLSAGQLIDLSGLKGLDRGSVGTYHHHALILIHTGGGSGKDIVKLSQYIQEKVYESFQVMIEPEVNFVD